MDLYSSLPKTISVPDDTLRKKKRQKEAVDDVLASCLPANCIKEGKADLASLGYKVQMLDKVRQTWERTANTHRRNALSCREVKKLKVFDIKPDGHKFKDYIPMHKLWQDYMRDILDMKRLCCTDKNKSKENHERLCKADYHGCMIVVKTTKCPSLLGMAGIVLMETRNTFKIITKQNKIKCIPKTNSVFAFELDGFMFTIYGNHFRVKTAERTRRKFKQKGTLEL